MSVFIVSIPNEQERKRSMRIRNGFEEFFCLCPNLSNDDKISAQKAGARFSKVPIIKGPGKPLPFTLKIEVSIVLHLTR